MLHNRVALAVHGAEVNARNLYGTSHWEFTTLRKSTHVTAHIVNVTARFDAKITLILRFKLILCAFSAHTEGHGPVSGGGGTHRIHSLNHHREAAGL